jgi:hypothetical protein
MYDVFQRRLCFTGGSSTSNHKKYHNDSTCLHKKLLVAAASLERTGDGQTLQKFDPFGFVLQIFQQISILTRTFFSRRARQQHTSK